MHFLHIIIPTYNRAAILLSQLTLLVNEEEFKDVLLDVIDNHSTDETKAVVAHMQLKHDNIRYFRRRSNVGGDLNIALSYSTPSVAEWLWILSDNDFILPGCLNVIWKHIHQNGTAAYIHFQSDWANSEASQNDAFKTSSLNDMFALGEGLEKLMLISSNIYNIGVFSAEKQVIYSATLQCPAGQIIPLELAHQKGFEGLFVRYKLITQSPVSEQSRWSAIDVLPRVSLLWRRNLVSEAGGQHIKKYIKQHGLWGSNMIKILPELLLRVRAGSVSRSGALKAVLDYSWHYLWHISKAQAIIVFALGPPSLLIPFPQPVYVFLESRWRSGLTKDYISQPLYYYK